MQTKAPPPIHLLASRKHLPIVQAYFEFTQLKQLYRQGWLKHGVPPDRCESVAEHSLGVAVLALWLVKSNSKPLSLEKVLIMALLHDFGEIYTGDLIPSDSVSAEEKYERESQSVQQVLGKLQQGEAYIAIWDEFEQGQSPEACFIRQVDRLEMGLQAGVYNLAGLIDPSEFQQTAEEALSEPSFKHILADVMDCP